MALITAPIMTEEVGQKIVDKLHTQNLLLGNLAGTRLEEITDIKEVQRIVRSGKAAANFNIGDQIILPWTDKATGKTYDVPMDVVHFGDVTLKDGETVPGMFLQWHYAIPFGVQFDNYEAFYYAEDGLSAGTYNITCGANWGTHCVANKTYQFTLTKDVPAGGQLAGFYGMPDQAAGKWRVYSFASKEATDPLETVSVTEGNGGTALGTMVPAGNGKINSLHRLSYGYNRWAQSAIRQFLNSIAEVGKWWSPQNNFDRRPDQLLSKAGFLSGFGEDFLSCIGEVKVTTALNTVTDAADGETEDTYDKFFLPSLQQMYVNPQKADVEGETWEYWKRASGLATPMSQGSTYPQIRCFAIENTASAQYVRLRSASRGDGNNAWYVSSSGYVGNGSAIGANRCAPACVIC